MQVPDYEDIRIELSRRLGYEPNEEVWARLIDEDYVRETREQTAGIEYLEEKYHEFDRFQERLLEPEKSAIDIGPRQIRLQILSDLIAHQAAAEQSVMVFRQEYLSEGLLKREEIVEWITSKAAEEGSASRYLRFPISGDHKVNRCNGRFVVEPPLTISVAPPSTRVEVEVLCYSTPADRWVRRTPVRHGGTLDKLRMLSEILASRFRWGEAQATTFILAGITPLLSSVRVGFRMMLNQPISSHINMEIDPTLTPEEVAEQYREFRAKVIASRYRSMTEKHLRLAEFYGGHKPEGTTWAALMDKWNRGQDRRWRYARFEAFARDCKQAWRRLMGRDLLKLPDL